jgi:hypothetical protein
MIPVLRADALAQQASSTLRQNPNRSCAVALIVSGFKVYGRERKPLHGPSAALATSTYRHNAFASRICLGVRHDGDSSLGDPTTIAAQRARDVATLRRFRLYRNSMPRGASSGDDVAIE